MNLRAFLVASAASLAFVSSAQADGPVFAVIPNTPTRGDLTTDRAALARARASERRAAAAVTRADAFSASAPLLSEQLDAERTAARLQVVADNAAARASELQQQIGILTTELQPVAPLTPSPPSAPILGSGSIGVEAVGIAEQYLGIPYLWGGADPATGFDCSGLTMYVYAQLGIRLRHYAADQWADLPHADPSQLEPGDLVFFEPRVEGPGHVGIYIGGDSFIEAPHMGDVVKIASLSEEAAAIGFVGAARPAAAIAPVNPFGF
jgi:cell wall-associated NlpC family hydrolase